MISLPNVLLAIAVLLIVISAIQPLARRLMISDAVLLAIVGILIGAGAAELLANPATDRFDGLARVLLNFPVSAETFLLVFLPILVFQGALTLEVRQLARDTVPVLAMAVVAVVVSTALVGVALRPLSGQSLTVCLMLGAIVATTDPSAVVGIFRDLGAAGRLTRLVEGEALLNDAAAIALFTLLLGAIASHVTPGPLEALRHFSVELVGGLFVGFVLARAVLFAIPLLDESTAGEATLTLALPYLAYLLCDQFLGCSGVVAAAAAGLTVNAYGPSTFRPASWRFLRDIWEQLAFWAGSLVFVLASMLVPRMLLGATRHDALLAGVALLAATVARTAVVFGLLPLLAALGLSDRVPVRFKITMVWGGLRGAITLAMALAVIENPLLPKDLQHFVAVVATGFVLFTLLVNGTTLRFLVRALGLDRLSASDEALRHQVLAIGLGEVRDRIGKAADEIGFSAPAREQVQALYARRIAEETAANEFDTAIGDRDRVRLALIAFASRERAQLLEMFQDRALPRRTLENLLRSAEAMVEGARTEGRTGYLRAARRRVRPDLRFRIAQALHRRFRIDRPLMACMMERFETLFVTYLLARSLDRFMRDRMRTVLGGRVAEITGEILARREAILGDAIDGLRLHYPGYAEALETRLLRQVALSREAREYEGMEADSLIGEELFSELKRELAERRLRARRRLRMDLQAGMTARIRSQPLFAGLQAAILHDIAMSMTLRFVAPGELVLRSGARVRSVLFVSSGLIEKHPGAEADRLGPGDSLGVRQVLDGTRADADYRALRFCHLLELRASAFRDLFGDLPDQAERLEAADAGPVLPPGATPPKQLEFDPVPLTTGG
jgi:CPA1 family monovalent cation:H+ antiporter